MSWNQKFPFFIKSCLFLVSPLPFPSPPPTDILIKDDVWRGFSFVKLQTSTEGSYNTFIERQKMSTTDRISQKHLNGAKEKGSNILKTSNSKYNQSSHLVDVYDIVTCDNSKLCKQFQITHMSSIYDLWSYLWPCNKSTMIIVGKKMTSGKYSWSDWVQWSQSLLIAPQLQTLLMQQHYLRGSVKGLTWVGPTKPTSL